MRKKSKKTFIFKVSSLCFVLGVLLLLVPYPFREEIETLPETGVEPALEVELTVDKSDVQRDDPSSGAQAINYTIRVRNTAECLEIPVNAMLVFDKSGSMLGLVNDAKEAGRTFVRNLDFSKDQAGIVTYDDYAHLLLGLSSSESALINSINSITASGMTNIGDGIDLARDELLSATNLSEATSVIIIFTDGQANRPSGIDAKQYAVNMATEAKNAGLRIISIAYGRAADQDLMRQIASSPSDFYFAPSGSDMVAIYAAIAESLSGNSPDTRVTVDLSQVSNIVDVTNISTGGSYFNGQLQWNLGTLECQVGMYQQFSLEVNINAQDLDIIDLIAVATNSAGYTAQSLNAVTTVHAPAFNLSKTDHKDEAMPGEALEYEIVVENVGTGNGYGVIIRDFLPPDYFMVMPRSISEDGSYYSPEETITWDNSGNGYTLDGSFEPTGSEWGSSKTFTFSGDVVRDLDPGLYTILNTVRITTSNGYTQEAYDETIIPYGPDISITKGSSPLLYTYPGGEVVFALIIRNSGNIEATGVVVRDDYDETYLAVNPEAGYVQQGVIVWDIGDLGVDEERTLRYTAVVNDFIGANSVTIPNEAHVTLNETDINPADNVALHEIIATQDPVLTITHSSDRTTYYLDEEITYTLVITNDSYSDAYNVVLQDVIPFDFDFVAGSVMLDGIDFPDPSGTHELVWSIGNLAQGESVTLTFRVRPNESCNVDNYTATATIVWEDEDGNLFGPIAASCTVSLVEEHEEITDGVGEVKEGELVGLVSDSLTGLIQAAQTNISSNLARAGVLVYLKVLLGLGLALPLPLLLIFGKSDKAMKKGKPVKKRKARVGRKKKQVKKELSKKKEINSLLSL